MPLGFTAQRRSVVDLKRRNRELVEVRGHLTLLAEPAMRFTFPKAGMNFFKQIRIPPAPVRPTNIPSRQPIQRIERILQKPGMMSQDSVSHSFAITLALRLLSLSFPANLK